MNKQFLSGLAILAIGGSLLTGCAKDPLSDLNQEDSRIYITNYDNSASFGSYATFAISDSVVVINDNRVSREQTTTDLAYINALRQQLQSRGYTEVNRKDNPDLAVNVNRVYSTSTGVISYDNYWDYYDAYYDPWYYGYGGYGYYSPYSYATYTIREGAISVDLLDLKNAASTNRITGIWTGLIRGSGIFNPGVADKQVSMLFEQSPYIRKK